MRKHNQQTDTNVKMTQILELSEKDFKGAITKVLQKIRANIL